MRDDIEKQFLSILYAKPEIGFDLLQINPNYLENRNNQLVLEAMIKSYEKLGVIDYAFMIDYSPKILDVLAEIISEEHLPINEFRKHFLSCQKSILDFYKKKIITELTNKLNSGKITCNEYLTKMSKIEEFDIKFNGNSLTLDEINTNIDTNKTRIILENYPKLDRLLELVEGDFLVIGASTGTGKSGLMLNLMNNLMKKYQCIYFNMEMSKSTIYKRMIAINQEIAVRNINSPETEYQSNLIEIAKRELIDNKVIIEHESTYLEEIEESIKTMKNEENKHTIIFLDHIGLIRLKSITKNIYEQTTDVVKRLRQLCLKYDCTIIAACQLNRTSYKSEELDLSMLKDSGEVENSASKIILLYRNKEYSSDHLEPEMILNICKNRDGMEGQIKCTYFKTKQVFKEK